MIRTVIMLSIHDFIADNISCLDIKLGIKFLMKSYVQFNVIQSKVIQKLR